MKEDQNDESRDEGSQDEDGDDDDSDSRAHRTRKRLHNTLQKTESKDMLSEMGFAHYGDASSKKK